MSKYSKLIGALVGAILSVGVLALFPALNVPWAALVTALLSALGTYVAPANTED